MMKNIVLTVMSCFVLTVAATNSVLAQLTKLNILEHAQRINLYDERGYEKNGNVVVDGNLVISESNGSASYVYPISKSTIDGYPLDVTLTYNGSVAMTSFAINKPQSGANATYWDKLSQNKPAWIIGVNGFAVQALSTLSRFHNHYRYWTHPLSVYTNNECVWAIDGYDFCNRMEKFDPVYNLGNSDKILLLRADGGLLELRNTTTVRDLITGSYNNLTEQSLLDERLYTGHYIPLENNTSAHGVVSYDDTYWPDFWKSKVQHPDQFPARRPRVLRYYPGDGLEYVFREIIIPYGVAPYDISTYQYSGGPATPENNINFGHEFAGPTIFYLEEINSGTRNLTTFTRSRHYPNDNPENYEIDGSAGRALTTGFYGHTLTYGDNNLSIEAFGKTTKIKFHGVRHGAIQNDETADPWVIKIPLASYGYDTQLQKTNNPYYFEEPKAKDYKQIFLQAESGVSDQLAATHPQTLYYYRDNYWSYIGLVTDIIDPENRSIKFDYEKYSRIYTGFDFPNTPGFTPETDSRLEQANWRLKQVVEPTDQYNITYRDGVDNTLTVENNADGYWSASPLTNNVVYKLEKYNKNSVLLHAQEYEFERITGGNSQYLYPMEQYDGEIPSNEDVDLSMPPLVASQENRALDIVWRSHVKTVDNITGLLTNKEIFFHRYKIELRRSNNSTGSDFEAGNTPLITSLTIPRKTTVTTGTITAVTTENYRKVAQNLFLPAYSKTTIATTSGDVFVKSLKISEYTLTDPLRYLHSTDVADRFGRDIATQKVSTYYWPGYQSGGTPILYSSDEIEYEHFPLVELTDLSIASRLDSVWLRIPTQQQTAGLRQAGNEQTDNVFALNANSQFPILPPIYRLGKKTLVKDAQGTILTGKDFTYLSPADFFLSYAQYRRGALVSEKIIGQGGNSTLTTKALEYSGGYYPTYRNLLKASVNILGAKEEFFYDYKLPELGGVYPTGKLLKNDGTIANKKIHNDFRLFESPLAKKTYVRKWNASAMLETNSLTEFYERSYFNMPYGLITGSVDANGWYSHFDYDWGGRIKRAWLPMDFAATNTGAGIQSKTVRLYGKSNLDKKIYQYTYASQDLVALPHIDYWIMTATDQYLRTDNNIIDNNKIIVHGPIARHMVVPMIQQPSPIQYPAEVSSQGRVVYKAYANDAVHQVNGDKKIYLRLYLASITGTSSAGSYADIGITAFPYSVNPFTRINIQPPARNSNNANNNSSNTSTRRPQRNTVPIDNDVEGVQSNDNYFIYVPLPDDLVVYMKQMSDGSTLEFQLTSFNTRGQSCRVEFANDADDVRPALVVNGTFPNGAEISSDDFTLAYKYDDYNLTSTVFAKVDHLNRTANPSTDFSQTNPLTGNSGSSRFADAFYSFGVDYKVKLAKKQGLETSFEYTGLGQLKNQTEMAVGYTTQTTYDEMGRPLTLTHSDNTTVANTYEVKAPSAFNITEEYYGLCSKKIVTDEKGIQTAQYYDAFDRLRMEVQDVQGTQVTVKYEYDKLNRLVQVINPNLQQTTYTYDEFGRVKSKSHVDLGTTSYAYDKVGNVRFSQSQKQHESNKVSFFQYDDLNRITVIGEATLQNTSGSPLPPNPATRLTDWLDPNVLHNAMSPHILTANATMFVPTGNGGNPPISFDPFSAGFLTFCAPADYQTNQRKTVDLLGENLPQGMAYMKHVTSPFPVVNTAYSSDPSRFESIAANAQFVQIGMWYDELPASVGGIWAHFPASTSWNPLAPTGTVRNLKGRLAAMAYRSHGSEPYHFVVYSYDERGRLEAQLRFTENLGFDAVYYKYNSMDQVISVTTADPMQQHSTWYATDNFGRIKDVSTALSTVNQGLLAPPGSPTPYMFPAPLPKPNSSDIAYVYNNRGLVGTMGYPGIGTSVDYTYNTRAWLTSVTAMNGLNPIFSQTLSYDDPNTGYDGRGQIWGQTWQHGTQPAVTQTYEYDNLRRLTEWEADGRRKDTYMYDKVGNRLQSIDEFGAPTGNTYAVGQNRMTGTTIPGEISTMSYDANGATTMREVRNMSNVVKERETLEYTTDGLLRLYHRDVNNYNGGNTRQWYYRYSAAGEREQKRMSDMVYTGNVGLPAPDGESIWVYYALGADGRQHAVYHGTKVQREICAGGSMQTLSAPYVYFYPTEYLTYGSGATANITMKRNANNMWTKEYKIQDQLGSTRVVLDAAGAVLGQYDYEPFGKVQPGPGPEQRLSWIDKEKDKESDLGDFGVRKYDDGLGRFLSTDALWEKYPSLTPYQYGANNPLVMVDPSGYQYDLSEAQKGDANSNTTYVNDLKTDLESITGLSLDIQNGKLVYLSSQRRTDANGNAIGSATAAKMLIKGIDAPEVVKVTLIDGITSRANPLDFNLDPSEITNFQQGVQNGLNPQTMGLGLSFLHESVHTTPFGELKDPSKGNFGKTGPVEDMINIIRSELGHSYGQRVSYSPGIPANNPNIMLLPFDTPALQAIQNGNQPSTYFIMCPVYP